MNTVEHIQLILSHWEPDFNEYHPFLVTDWMEPSELDPVLYVLQTRFPSPNWRITITERKTTTTTQTQP